MKYGRFVSAVILVCGLAAGQLFAQAAAESVLTHGLSSTAGSSLGKTLGNAIGNAAGQLGGRLGQQTAPAVQRVPVTKARTVGLPATTPATASFSGSLIASIQGGATSTPTCAATSKTAEANSSPTKATTAAPTTPAPVATMPASVPPASNCQTTQDADSHPAVVNLPAAN